MSIVSPIRLISLALSARHDSDAASQLGALRPSEIDWSTLLDLARTHRVLPLLATELPKHIDLPLDVADELSDHLRANARRILSLTGHLSQLLSLLAANDIPAVPFKGPVLASQLYGSLACRESGDLDVLVPRGQALRARRLLVSRGYLPVFPTSTFEQTQSLRKLEGDAERRYVESHAEHHLVRETPGGELINVDLHWSIALTEFGLPIAPASLWTDLREHPLAGRTVRTFSPEQLLVILCVNGAKDCWRRLDRVCDVAELLHKHPHLDWNSVQRHARRWRCDRILGLGLRLASDLLHAPLPVEIDRTVSVDPTVHRLSETISHWLDANTTPDESTLDERRFHLATRRGLFAKSRYVASQLKPTVGDATAIPLPPILSFAHYALRPVRLATSLLRRSMLPAP